MSEYDWTDDHEEALNDRAVRLLVARHPDEYEDLVAETLEGRLSEAEARLSEAQSEIRRLRGRLERTTRERDRWKGRIEEGVVERLVSDS